MGLSELVCNYFLWKALSDPAFCGVVFSKTQADTSNLAKRIKRLINQFGNSDSVANSNLKCTSSKSSSDKGS